MIAITNGQVFTISNGVLDAAFLENGGFTERLYKLRQDRRGQRRRGE